MNVSRRLAYAPFVFAMFLSASCDESLKEVAGPTPNLEPTLASIQREIFNVQDSTGRLACTQCHSTIGGRTPSSGLNLMEGVAFQSLVSQGSRGKPGAVLVIPGDPDNSYLIKKLEGAADISGVRMPRSNGPYLTAGQISIIRRWIELGAKNN